MWDNIAKYRDDVDFRKINRYGARVVKTDAQAIGLYPVKYTPEQLLGEGPLEATVFVNPFSRMSGKYPHNFRAEG